MNPIYDSDPETSLRQIRGDIESFSLGKGGNNRYNLVQTTVTRSSPLVVSNEETCRIGRDHYLFDSEAVLQRSSLFQSLLREIREEGLRVIHLFSGSFDWSLYGNECREVLSNDFCRETPSGNHDHPIVFLEGLRKDIPEGWADVVIYGGPFNQLLMKHYLSEKCGGERETEFHRLSRETGTKHGDAGLSSRCKKLLNYFLKPNTGRAFTLSYKTTGFGIKMGYSVLNVEIMPHSLSWDKGGFACHDSMIVLERKIPTALKRILLYPLTPSLLEGPVHRTWSMYCSGGRTFSVDGLRSVLERTLKRVKETKPNPLIVDPFSRNSGFGGVCNDLSPETDAPYHMDAVDFLIMIRDGRCKEVPEGMVDVVLLDPPYSDVQSVACYQRVGVGNQRQYTINSKLYSDCKAIIADILNPGGIVITFGWSSLGMSQMGGFQRLETAVVCHGASHDDTIVTVDQKNDTK